MPFRSQAQRGWMFRNHPRMAKRWARHTPKGRRLPGHVSDALLPYVEAGCGTVEEVLAMAASRGPVALSEAQAGLLESGHRGSMAMVVVPAEPPGRELCDFLRGLAADRSRLVVAVQEGRLAPGNFERLSRASMPDCEDRLRFVDRAGRDTLDAAISAAIEAGEYEPSQALEVFCDVDLAAGLSGLDGGFDPALIAVNPIEVPADDVDGILQAFSDSDEAVLQRVVDPHLFSSQDSMDAYREALIGEGLLREDPMGDDALYHGSHTPIASVKTSVGGGAMDFGPGMYFATDRRDAAGFGRYVYRARVSLSSPLTISRTMTPEMDRFRKAFRISDDDLTHASEGIWHQVISLVATLVDIGELDWARVTRFLRKLGYDSIVVPNDVVRQSRAGSQSLGDYVVSLDPQAQVQNWTLVRESLREFLMDIAPSREIAIGTLRDIMQAELGDEADGLQYLGSGRNGSAYRHPDGFIVKMTTDPVEARSASRLEGLETQHLGRIFQVRPVRDGVWMIIQEDLQRLPDGPREDFDWAMGVLSKRGVLDMLNSGRVLEALDSLVRDAGPAGSPDVEEIASVLRRFGVVGMCKELRRLGLTADFHSGNVMLRGGSPVLVDLGTPGEDPGERLHEFGTGAPGSGAAGPATMRGSNSSSWSNGRGALKAPQNHVPEDENATEGDIALDWGPGRVTGASF